jgi:hypothetical protein
VGKMVRRAPSDMAANLPPPQRRACVPP